MEKKLKYLFKSDIYDIYIIRHPEVENHHKNVFNGHIDVDLSERGYKQAKELIRFFEDKSIGYVYSSPLKRCKIVAEGFSKAEVVIDDRLKERSFGIFESLRWEDIERLYPYEAEAFLKDPFFYRPEKGESFEDVRKRVVSFIKDRLKQLKGNILILAHGGVNRVFIKEFLSIQGNAVLNISQDYACINHFESDGDFVLAKLINGKVCFDRGI
ncbi:histidine phosphatase family protein [Hippea maritima]|uniref:Phosphoglycerate mutase n=1 Tax=Hippea maritima (strain ATCC 700847 / DSM 10411 / MH2) TaxID=760142 RepID=F2LTU9_HIPMA|nr:histidine phosphatase family protein [Hippea maritima]AEA34475.1 Phosphoglycerate mutase [Hippea maritima DSM 10411]